MGKLSYIIGIFTFQFEFIIYLYFGVRKMKLHLALTLAGTFVLDDSKNIINTKPFKLDPKEVAAKIVQLDSAKLPSEIKDILEEHKDDELIIRNLNLSHVLANAGYKVTFDPEDAIILEFQKNIASNLHTMGMIKQVEDYQQFLRETVIQITKERVRQAADKRDRLIVHAIESIDDLDKTLNLFSSRLREFYGMHFPELVDAIENHNTFAMIISESGDKSKITKEILIDKVKFPKEKANQILDARKTTMGSELLSQDIQIIRDQAKIVVDLYKRRQTLEKWMDEAMRSVAPNICGVINPLLGARLISLAGSLKDLALSASSKIQILGAEKALYRTIKTGAPPPKHGIIYQDSRLNQSKWWQRGKIARVLSGRISIAARMDFFEAEDKSQELAIEVNDKINEIIEKYPNPPSKPKRTHRAPPKKGKGPYRKKRN
ncbi:MAG: C/D box methylation guide ribonucleoprotein complex aNOP56 subunit [Asgard group archaeon]|nr:C/D box methylation guide ribonucleoprotein complex aNOP56 subunit [Asgard group archaeon]